MFRCVPFLISVSLQTLKFLIESDRREQVAVELIRTMNIKDSIERNKYLCSCSSIF